MEIKDLLQFCKLYRGEPFDAPNPINKHEDEFKWEMWRSERGAVLYCIKTNKNLKQSEECIKRYIKNHIDMYASVPFGGDPAPYYERYSKF